MTTAPHQCPLPRSGWLLVLAGLAACSTLPEPIAADALSLKLSPSLASEPAGQPVPLAVLVPTSTLRLVPASSLASLPAKVAVASPLTETVTRPASEMAAAGSAEPAPALSEADVSAPPPAPPRAQASARPSVSAMDWAAQAPRWQPGSSACAELGEPAWTQLTLSVALAHTLCKSPAMRIALAQVSEQTASVQVDDASGRPRWSLSGQLNTSRDFNNTGGQTLRSVNASLGLSWVLFDFGQRSAQLQSARKTLAAALAQQDGALLDAVREQLRLYGEAVVAQASLQAAVDAETTATRTADAARARFEARVGSQIDRLQAQTALAQATLGRTRAQTSWESARASLALALGADVAQPIGLADWEVWAEAPWDAADLAVLQREAQALHPLLISKQAEIDSLKARLEAVKADARGSVAFAANVGPSRTWLGSARDNASAGSAALVATIPLFNGRESDARLAQVLAQTDAREAEFEAVRRDIQNELWQAHQALLTSQQSLVASQDLLAAAESTYQVAQGRYRAGVGSILDLLNAQSALADARRQKVTSQVDRLTARTRVGLAAGRIGAAVPQGSGSNPGRR